MYSQALLQSQLVPQNIANAVQTASAKTGVDFDYLLKQAQIESGFKADAKAKGSSATGLYQFIEQTWLRMVDAHGAQYGRGEWADAITQDSSGRFSVAGGLKSEILDGRKDAVLSAMMAAELASENKAVLAAKTGKSATATDLYMAHFLGVGGASSFLKAMDENPLQTASTIFPAAARANRAVFYNDDGTAKSLAEVYTHFNEKFEVDADEYDSVAPALTARVEPSAIPTTIDPVDLLNMAPSRVHDGLTYSRITSPIQTMIGNDLLSGPILAFFARTNAHVDSGLFNA